MKQRAIFIGSLIVIMFVATACQQQSVPSSTQKSPEQIVSDGMKKLSDVKSSSFNLDVKANLQAPPGETPKKIDLILSMQGASDMTVVKDPKLNLKISGSVNADDTDGGNAEAELKMNKDALFLHLAKLEGKGSVQITESMKAQIAGKWWKMAIPAEVLDQLTKAVPLGNNAEDNLNLTESQKKIKTTFENTKFFKDVKYVGTEKVMTEDSDNYSVVLDKKALQDFVVVASEAEGTQLSEDEKQQVADSFKNFDFIGNVFVGKSTGIVNKISGKFIINEELNQPSGEVAVEISMGDFNKPVAVEVPTQTTDLPLQDLLGGFLPMPVPTDPTYAQQNFDPSKATVVPSEESAPVQSDTTPVEKPIK